MIPEFFSTMIPVGLPDSAVPSLTLLPGLSWNPELTPILLILVEKSIKFCIKTIKNSYGMKLQLDLIWELLYWTLMIPMA